MFWNLFFRQPFCSVASHPHIIEPSSEFVQCSSWMSIDCICFQFLAKHYCVRLHTSPVVRQTASAARSAGAASELLRAAGARGKSGQVGRGGGQSIRVFANTRVVCRLANVTMCVALPITDRGTDLAFPLGLGATVCGSASLLDLLAVSYSRPGWDWRLAIKSIQSCFASALCILGGLPPRLRQPASHSCN